MRLRSTTFNPLFRCFAALTLVAWLGAQVVCQAHCVGDECHGDAVAAEGVHQDDDDHAHLPDQQDSCEDASCLTLKSALTGDVATTVAASHFSLLYTLVPFVLSLDASSAALLQPSSRQDRLRERAFTPELRLGPAFRSQAPPSSFA